MDEKAEDIDPVRAGKDSIEVEIVSDEEFQMLDEAIQNAMMRIAQQEETKSTEHGEDITWSSIRKASTPLEKFKGGRGYLSVTDLTAQFWCEQQMEYSFSAPELKLESEPMKMGKLIHLERELELYDLVEIKVESKEDNWATRFLDCLCKISLLEAQQTVRELPVFGWPFNMGVFVYGIIDEVHYNEMGQLELLELKTRTRKSLPSKAQQSQASLQAMIYSIMFNDLLFGKVDASMLLSQLQLKGDAILSEDVSQYARQCGVQCNRLIQIINLMLKRFQQCDITKLNSIAVEYCMQETCQVIGRTSMDLDTEWTQSQLVKMLPYWKGERGTVGVEIEEAWKCSRCEFADICEWRIKKDKEYRTKSD
ncbi:exonuclease V-like [Stylophora pistillata]|uniref:Exonuclease V n=1 Tax=Stylophora pistillata TaxID=50429 RepID=A0A2B4S958_STYPI|nr:exonuclease V-like [Stylophora pistillata]PFX25629.1 Exonuclease V [Stylophora pistillata]